MIPRICLDKRLIILLSLIALVTGPFIRAEIPSACPDVSPAGTIVRTADKVCYTGTDPGHGVRPLQMAGGRSESLTGSTVAFYPAGGGDACWYPVSSHTFCFLTDSYSPDYEYVYNLWLNFPADWTVTNVTIAGTPTCDNGSWGSFSWSNETPNLVNIYHPRYQGSGGAHCTAMYLVTVTTGAAGPDAQVSWYWDGDGYNSAPHNPCSNDNFTPPSMSAQPCDEAINPRATVPACSLSGVYLAVSPSSQEACPGEAVTYPVTLQNYTGAAATFNISVSGNSWAVSAPATVGPVADSGTMTFDVTHTIDPAAADGATDVPTITAVDQANAANTDSATFTTSAGLGFWHTVTSSSPSWLGAGYPCRGCTARNASGQWNTYIIGDTSGTGPVGFWAYNHATNTWSQPAPSGLPADRWSPGWAYDSATNLCYMTGGANVPGGGTYNTAYVYDPVANAFTALPSFTSVRDFHNSWIGTIDGTRYLAIGGGVNNSGTYLSSTQCLNLSTNTWQAESTVMPAFTFGARWASAEGFIPAATGDQFWLASGADGSGNLVTSAYYFDDADNAWHAGGDVPTAVYRTNGAVSGGDFYVIGGSTGGFTPSDQVQRYSGGAWETLDPMPHSRMDLVCGVGADDTIWVVDGQGSSTANYVDYFEFCQGSGGCSPLLDQPLSTVNTNAYVDQDFTDYPASSSYLADDFTNSAPWTIDAITIPGNGWNGFTTLMNATSLNWAIYADNAGIPAGYPGDGATTPQWSLSLPPGDASIVLSNGTGGLPSNVEVTLSAPPTIPAGTWWLIFWPVMSYTTDGQYGRQGSDTTNGYMAKFINPGGGFGYGTAWQDWTVLGATLQDMAFSICATTGTGCTTLAIAPATLPDATVGLAYSQTVTASGGTAPYTYEVTSGVLPPGLTLNTTTGVISGTPTSGGSYTFTITATDSAACTGTITYTINFDYNWNMSVVDDSGRSSACLNTDTGYYAWTVLTGFGAGTYVGHSNVTFAYNTYYFQSGKPSGMNMKVSMTTNRASGTYISPPLHEKSICIDSDITDNPSCP